jgi:hypothetical protein
MYRRAMMLIGRVDEGSNYGEFVATLYHNLAGIAHAQGRYVEGLKHAGARRTKRLVRQSWPIWDDTPKP